MARCQLTRAEPVNQRGNENRERRVENRAPNRISRARGEREREERDCEVELRETECSKGGKMCKRGGGREGVVRSCGWRASLNGRAQRGESGRRFWARRFSPVERVFTAECVGARVV